MRKSPIRSIGSQFTAAAVAVIATAVIMGGGLAFAQETPAAVGAGVAEVAAANSVDSAAIINGSVTGQDIAASTVGRGDIKPSVLTSWAKVGTTTTTATLLNDRGVASAAQVSNGSYRVTFDRPIVGCGWSATLNDNDAGAGFPGEITVERDTAGDPTSLRVRTYNSAGTQGALGSSDGFTVTVDC